jgi:hypothetical protein
MLDRFRKSFLTVPVFVSRAYSELEALDGDQYRMRSVPGAKELIEEVVPLAALLKHLEIPGRHIRCRFVGGQAGHDAQIRVSGRDVDLGWLKPSYFVEVTVAVSSIDFLKREALTRNGYVFGGEDIQRVKKGKTRGVVSRAAAVDGEKAVDDVIAWATKSVAAKGAKRYPRPCILVVSVQPERPLRVREWSRVIEALHPSVDRSRFERAFLVDWGTNTVFQI